jgi:hypothetical protein
MFVYLVALFLMFCIIGEESQPLKLKQSMSFHRAVLSHRFPLWRKTIIKLCDFCHLHGTGLNFSPEEFAKLSTLLMDDSHTEKAVIFFEDFCDAHAKHDEDKMIELIREIVPKAEKEKYSWGVMFWRANCFGSYVARQIFPS